MRAAAGAARRFTPISRSPTACAALVQPGGRDLRPPRHPDQHGVGLRAAAVRRPDASPTGTPSLNVDLRAAFLCAHAAAPHMRAQGGGRIINFSDWVARSGRPRYPGFLPYYVAKAGVIALTEALALELAADNILVNADRARADPRAAGHDRRGIARGRRGDAARPVGRRDRDREGRARAARQRFHHRRNHPRRRRPPPEIAAGQVASGGSRPARTSTGLASHDTSPRTAASSTPARR